MQPDFSDIAGFAGGLWSSRHGRRARRAFQKVCGALMLLVLSRNGIEGNLPHDMSSALCMEQAISYSVDAR